jgi:O-acetyl-ADP-ribose deacetylase (regulator of RNase III)
MYRGLLGLGQGIQSAAQDWAKKYQETQQQLGESDILFDYARQHNLVSPEEAQKYTEGSAAQKNSLASGWAKTISLNQAQELQKAQLENARQIAAMHIAAQNAATPVISSADVARAQSQLPEGYTAVQTTPRSMQIVQNIPKPVYTEVPVTDPATGKQIGVRIGNQISYYPRPSMLEQVLAGAFGGGLPGVGGGTPTFPQPGTVPAPAPAPAPPPPTQPPPTPNGLPQVTSQDQYNALPSGSVYIAPDGTKRTKP